MLCLVVPSDYSCKKGFWDAGIGPADRRGKARRSGGETELLSTETGKHDYDWYGLAER
jgi:hypothetical protein